MPSTRRVLPSLILAGPSRCRCCGTEWPVAGDRRAVHEAALPVIVVDRIVHGAAIVPDGESVSAPAEAASEFRQRRMGVEKIEQRLALGPRHALKARRVDRVDEERLAAGLGMNADGRMAALDIGLGIVAADRDRAAG